ncbi:MAG: redoxin domain-containing protein [Acidobacteria bacterium]|nr:redoxin domain-containing protein [Acidobacteriota bacterium]
MEILLLLLRLGLAGVMALAGFAKLADLEGSQRAFEGFGVPASLSKVGPILLSVFEIALAAMLLFAQTSWDGAIGSLALLVLFIGQMSYQVAKGNAPDCHCFGQVYSAPVSAMSVVRNVVFAIPAGVLVARGQGGQGAAFTDPNVNTLELAFGVVITAFLFAVGAYVRKIAERQQEILKQLEVMDLVARDGGGVERNEAGHPHDGLPIGAVAPEFSLTSLAGEPVSSGLLVSGMPLLAIFVSPSCTPCRSLIPDFEQWIDDLSGKVKVVFITTGDAEENRQKFGNKIGSELYLQSGREVSLLFRAQWTPSAVLIDAGGRIASQVTAGDTAIRSLVEAIENEDLTKEGLHFTVGNGHGTLKAPIGSPVPEIRVSDLQGREITSDYFRGKSTLVTFWSTTCPHCDAMLDDLRNWEKARGQDEPNLLVFSDGDAAKHAALELESPVVIDPGHKTAGHFGMYGTPSAVLVNEKGVFASETAVGAADIWSLIGKRK